MNTQQPSNQLKKVLGASFGIAILVGSTIGVGILRTPGSIAALLNNYWLIVLCWIAGGVYVLLGVGTYAELSTMLPKAGGSYNYIKKAFGNYWGFLTGWFDYLANAITPAFFCIVIGEYVVILFPFLQQFSTVIAVAFLFGFVLLHAFGVKAGSLIQQVTSLLKLLLFVVLIIACFFYGGVKLPPLPINSGLFSAGALVGFLKALQLVLGTYNGWAAGSYFAEEDKDPGKNIPASMYRGAAILIIVYTLVNVAFLAVLPVSSIANTALAAADVAKHIFGDSGAKVVTVIALFSLISILNAYMMIPSRILFGLSRDGFFFRQGTFINKGGTPLVALLVSGFFAFVLILIGSFEILFTVASSFSILVWGMAYASLMRLRKKAPDLKRPHLSWGYPYTSIIMVFFSAFLFVGIVISDLKNLYALLIIIMISYPLFQKYLNGKIRV